MRRLAFSRIRPVSSGARSGLPGRGSIIALAVVPLLLFYGIFLLFPLAWSFFMSFHDWPGASFVRQPEFVGLDNYHFAFFEDHLFKRSLLNTFLYTVMNIPINLVVALFLAVFINSLPRYRSIYRTLFFLPVLVSEVASSILWRYVYQSRFGLINSFLTQLSDSLGIPIVTPRWLEDTNLAMFSIVMMTVWMTMGYTLVIFLAGLQGIPENLYEAARVDGASTWHRFRFITLPLLRPTIAFLLITKTIGSLQIFGPMYVMTDGGPIDATRTIVLHLYEQAFDSFKFGYASSIAVILFFIVLFFSIIQVRFLRQGWDY
jgi:multiple sugar transport system permease protein